MVNNIEVIKRLQSLRVSNIQGKRVIVLGCDVLPYSDFFKFDGAREVYSFDLINYDYDVERFVSEWELAASSMDVIIMLYSDELNVSYSSLLQLSLRKLSISSLLCVELPKHKNLLFGLQERNKRILTLLGYFAKKSINSTGPQISQDYNSSCIYHVQVKKNYVFLLSGSPGTGKSTLASSCFSSEKIPLISGDRVYKEIFEGKIKVREPANRMIQREFKMNRIYRLTHQLFESELQSSLVDCWVNLANKRSFILDSCIPKEFLPLIEDEFKARGYIPVNLTWDSEPTMEVEDLTNKKVNQFVKYMTKGSSLLRGLLKKK